MLTKGQDLPGANEIVQATQADRRLRAQAGTGPTVMRIDNDADIEINETFIEHEYSGSDVELHEKDINDKKKEAAAKVFVRVRTTLAKPYNAGDDKLRVPDKRRAKKGMRMKITDKSLKHSETFVVKALGSIIMDRQLQHDYEAGSTIIQTHYGWRKTRQRI